MSVVKENWQSAKPFIRERSKFIFNNDLFSDVKFVVRARDEKSESKKVIPAHKLVLSISSPVFEAMFYGDLAETKDSIELPDCEYESLLELFRYMYSDEVNLSGSNVMGVLYLAKKYIVPSLAENCSKYLSKNLDPSNVFSILPSAQKYEEKDLVDRCWEMIDKHTEEAVESDEFATIQRSLLNAVVIRDTLRVEEIELFKAVDVWATKECERQGLEPGGANKRRILGEETVKAIRFPIMILEDFAGVVLDSKILNLGEVSSIVKYLSSVTTSAGGFLDSERSPVSCACSEVQRCLRFRSFRNLDDCKTNSLSVLEFSVNKRVMLHGVYIRGQADILSCAIELTVSTSDRKSKKVSGEFSVENVTDHDAFPYWGYKILLTESLLLRKNTLYRMEAKISGTISWCGNTIINPVTCSGVTFTFKETPVEGFPELLFSSII